MPLVTERAEVARLYSEAAERRWVIPAFGTENLTTTEAILAGTAEHGRAIGCPDLQVTIAITHTYPGRSQSANYTHTGDGALGLRLFLADIRALTDRDSPFAALRVMTHLDHGQHDTDRAVLDGDLSGWSSVMFDASTLPMPENIAATRDYVRHRRDDVLIEGACDEISESGTGSGDACTSVELAEQYARETGVDIIVANLGTEHRAGASSLAYRGDRAREISRQVGSKICLHGASSIAPAQLDGLFADGIRKVNLWTALERDSSPVLLEHLARNAARAAGPGEARRLQSAGWLGATADSKSSASLDFFTTRARQQVVFEEMKRMVVRWLGVWYRP